MEIGAWTHRPSRYDARTRTRAMSALWAGPKHLVSVNMRVISGRSSRGFLLFRGTG